MFEHVHKQTPQIIILFLNIMIASYKAYKPIIDKQYQKYFNKQNCK